MGIYEIISRKKNKESIVLILNADDLRDHGTNISRKISWERTGEDFLWQMTNNPKFSELAKYKHMV